MWMMRQFMEEIGIGRKRQELIEDNKKDMLALTTLNIDLVLLHTNGVVEINAIICF
ncbi:hypothetical protein GCM10023313_32220 [Mucilaginibacter defluvii]|uniref:Uncharacterized protein n=1 Tax=Mucilaginibacter defluvii TaxID=1196019 RepID=A0ABP9G0T7_9SPHI